MALGLLWQVKGVFAVEAAGAVQHSRVQPLRMVRRGKGQDAAVGSETIQLVQEEGAVLRSKLGVEVFQHDDARSRPAGTVEDGADAHLVHAMRRAKVLDVETGLGERADERLYREGFAVARRADEQDAAFPRNVVLFVRGASIEEP